MDAEEIKTKLEEFDKRWEIVNEIDYGKEFKKFKIRFMNFLKKYISSLTIKYGNEYCKILGINISERDLNPYSYTPDTIIKSFEDENNEKNFYRKIQILFYLPEKVKDNSSSKRLIFYDVFFFELKEILTYSKINLELLNINDEVVLHRKGEILLDEKLVNEVLKFLNPESKKHLIESLKFYLEENDRSYIKSAESLRRTIEEFLRFKLQNKKGLDANIKELAVIHKKDDKDKQVRNVINNVFIFLDTYFNENSKHQDGDIDENECEYLIYQTGVLLRYINKLVLSDKE
jgi:hypothetical protein